MNKMMKNVVGKKGLFLISVIMAVLVIAAAVVSALCGVNYGITTDSSRTLTVSVNRFFYENDIEAVETVCETEFENQKLAVEYEYKSEMSGDNCEIVYVFTADEATAQKVAAAKAALETTIQTNTAENGDWYGFEVNVTTGSEFIKQSIPEAWLYRAISAVAAFAALSFVYVALRHKSLNNGIVAAISPIATALLATAVVLLVRLPITYSVFYAVVVAALLSNVFTLFTLNKLNVKADDAEEKNAEEAVAQAAACKEVLLLAAVLGVALVLMGAIATSVVRWFAITAFVGLLAAVVVALGFIPALYVPLKKGEDKKLENRNASGYVGATKKEEKEEA